ncbi:hypothetical protein PFY10_15490 [Chryseobacterium daecheongense]|nr:hypothetical protein PFY10_15490 [Chryseobacterium daecheongense]
MSSSRNIGLQSFFLSLFVFFGICIFYYIVSISKTDGQYVYPLDDAYIHLAIARNFALHDVWGITRYGFSSTSSSPLFTFMISFLIQVFGNHDQIPLYFNITFALGILYFLSMYYGETFRNVKNTVLATLVTLFFAVLHLQVLSGMEHVFQVFLFIVNMYSFSNWNKSRMAVPAFYLSLILMGLVRFESMFYFVILAGVLITVKKWKNALGVLIAGFVPVLLFCYFNYQQDGYFFPNSVVVKGTQLTLGPEMFMRLKTIFLDHLFLNKSFYKIGIFPILISIVFICRDTIRNKSLKEMIIKDFFLIVFSLLMICHAMFADLKGMFRYEAYILIGFCMAIIPRISALFSNYKSYIKGEKLITILVIMNILLLFYKSWFADRILENGGKNIYEQQIQSARFLHTYYNTSKVVANDIGAISYYTDIHLLDIVGLGSVEMIPFTADKRNLDEEFENFLIQYTTNNKYEIAVIYDEWFQGHIPRNWKKIAVLKIKNMIAVSKDEVSIYALEQTNPETLRRNIRDFKWNKNVEVRIVD